MWLCVFVCVYACVYGVFRCSQRPESIRSSKPRVIGGCEVSDVRVGSQTWVLGKNSVFSSPLSHLSSLVPQYLKLTSFCFLKEKSEATVNGTTPLHQVHDLKLATCSIPAQLYWKQAILHHDQKQLWQHGKISPTSAMLYPGEQTSKGTSPGAIPK